MSDEEIKLNNEIKLKVKKMTTIVANSIDPQDHILHKLFEEDIITIKKMSQIDQTPEVPRRANSLLQHLFETSHPRAFLVFIKALEKDYQWLVNEIHKQS